MSELADTSAWIVSGRDRALSDEFSQALRGGAIATCDAVKFELLYGARNSAEFVQTRADLDLLQLCPIGPPQFRRALDVYEEFAKQGGMHHRRVKRTDLVIAAAAESAGVGIVHYDGHFEEIAEITGQQMRWIAPRGSIG